MKTQNDFFNTMRHTLGAFRSSPNALYKNLLHFFLAIITITPSLAQTPDSSLVELPDQRTYFSKTYYNAEDNTYTAHLSAGYIHYRAEDGSYREINTNLKADSVGGYRSDEGLYKVGFSSSATRASDYDVAFELPKPVHEKFRNPGRAPTPPTRLNWKILSLGYFDRQSKRYQVIENAKSVMPVVSGSEISYLQAFNGIDVNYTCANTRLKEELVLSQEGRDKLPDPGQYGISRANAFLVFATEFALTPNNIRVFARADAGRISVRQGNNFAFEGDDPIDFEDDDQNPHFFFPKDYAWAVNDSATGFAGQISVKRYFYSDRGKHYLLIGVPYSWITSSPAGTLIIDPTISPTPSGDTWLESSTNNGTSTTLKIGKHTGAFKKRTLVKFNVSTVPTSATVLNAQLKLYYYSASNGGSGNWVDRWVQVHQMLRNWNELQADSLKRLTGINWLAPRAKIGPGADSTTADANGQFESTLLIQQSQYGYKSWDLTALTQKWVKVSGPGSAPNYGVILWATNEGVNGYDLCFFSGSTTPPANLTVTYSTQAKTVYFLKDHLGSIRATVQDSTGIPVRGYDDYDPWGYIMGGRTMTTGVLPSNATRNKFTGKEYDDEFSVNWNYFGARYYDAQIGRWMVRDALAKKYPGWSPYVYALDNPISFFDPNGKEVRFGSRFERILNVIGFKTENIKRLEHIRDRLVSTPTGKALYERLDARPQIININLASPLLTESGTLAAGKTDVSIDADENKITGDIQVTIDPEASKKKEGLQELRNDDAASAILGHEFGHVEKAIENPQEYSKEAEGAEGKRYESAVSKELKQQYEKQKQNKKENESPKP